MTSLKEAIASAAVLLNDALPQQARRDAELLLMHTLDCTRTFVLSHPEAELTTVQAERFRAAVSRRISGEPMQYILGEQEFYGLRFRVTPDVLIPRPETEHLVEAVLARADHEVVLRIADVGTGSGAIAVALAKHLPMAEITALDISAAALGVAQENAGAHGVAERIRFLESDLLGAVVDERFDIVVSNPPYVALGDRESLAVEVREHEPAMALFAGTSGLEIYERLIPHARTCLMPGGWLMLELGYGQQSQITALLEGWIEVDFLADLQGIPRVAIARRRPQKQDL